MVLELTKVFGAGTATFLSPCILPLIPIYLGMLLGASVDSIKESGGRFKIFISTLVFTMGFTLVFTLLGLGASSLGTFLAEHRSTLMLIGGILIMVFGLYYLGIFKIPFLDREKRFKRVTTNLKLFNAFIFGVVFALGWTPCVGPILGTVLTYTAASTSSMWEGAGYLAVYSLGLGLPLIIIGVLADRLLPLLKKVNRHLPKIKKVTGALMMAIGLWLVFSTGTVPGVDKSMGLQPGYTDSGQAVQPLLGAPTKRPRLVAFTADDCSVCNKMKPRIAQLRKDCVGKRIEILSVNISRSKNRKLAKRYRISAVPTFGLFTTTGKEKVRLVGERPLSELRASAAMMIQMVCAGQNPGVARPHMDKENYVCTTASKKKPNCVATPPKGSES